MRPAFLTICAIVASAADDAVLQPPQAGDVSTMGARKHVGKNSNHGTHRANAPNTHSVPVTHHHANHTHVIKHHKEHRHAGGRNNAQYKTNETFNSSAIYDVCDDLDPDWNNKHGLTCAMYTHSFCTGDGFRPHSTQYSGAEYEYPEKQCCSCGGGKAKDGQFYEPPSSRNTTAPAEQEDSEEDEDVNEDGVKTWDPDAFCMDTPNWHNQAGLSCTEYATKEYCHHGSVTKEGMGGKVHNFPETNCCECGGGSSSPTASARNASQSA